jgi:hypothetical protein
MASDQELRTLVKTIVTDLHRQLSTLTCGFARASSVYHSAPR